MAFPGFTAHQALTPATGRYRSGATRDGGMIAVVPASFTYDCSGKVDGNYPHPTKCDHYIACVAGTHAYEMPCAMGHDGQRLHYVQDSGPDPAKSRCDYPEVAGCAS
ncbi:chitin binding peritrophin-A domain-containing protein [Actinokineospora xionganensis]|uniref:Chitin binding domain-containing protein n=1 Tax=Actinokineospora xionganensis TaxID=2684470 RepID=A0ABR7L6K1_9PSEU|nr:chitin binding peritrophin-A domain-containing protein [Actinokineospora xionganensis]MBC6448039.1 chitin binding domain-containing protein [Actinokineospora xionganensis]